MPRRMFTLDNFSKQMNNGSDAANLLKNELNYLSNMTADKSGQVRSCGKESGNLKTITGYQFIQGTNLYHCQADRSLSGSHSETRAEWLVSGDQDTGDVSITELHPNLTGKSAIDLGNRYTPGLSVGGSLFRLSAYMFDGALRISDGSFFGTPKWFGHIKRTWFPAGNTVNHNDYYVEPAGLKSFDDCGWSVLGYGDDDNPTPATNSCKIKLHLHNDPEKTNYQWKKKFQVAASIVYDERQESLLTVADKVIDGENVGVADPSVGMVEVSLGSDFSTDISRRATHVKVYMREYGTELWYLQATFDLHHGGSIAHNDDYIAWAASGSHHICRNVDSGDTDTWMEEPSFVFSYDVEAGHSPDIKVIDFARATEGWRYSCVVGRTVYLGYCNRTNEHGQIEFNGDVLWKSLPNQPDKFIPINKNITVVEDSIKGLLGGASSVYEFRSNSMRIIDVSQEIEDIVLTIHNNGGIDEQDKCCMTPFGPVWMNTNGLFGISENGLRPYFDRQDRERSIKSSMDIDWWNTNIYSNGDCGLGYDPTRRQVLASNYDGANGIIYNLANRSWHHFADAITTLRSNMVTDSRGNLVFLQESGGDTLTRVFDFTSQPNDSNIFRTGSTDFENSRGIVKHLYFVIIKYKHHGGTGTTLEDNVLLYLNGDTSSPIRMEGSMVQTSDWAYAKYSFASPDKFKELDTAQIEINGYDFNVTPTWVSTILEVGGIYYDKRPLTNKRII